ncbi:ipis-1-like [Haemaphysalis longicornis]
MSRAGHVGCSRQLQAAAARGEADAVPRWGVRVSPPFSVVNFGTNRPRPNVNVGPRILRWGNEYIRSARSRGRRGSTCCCNASFSAGARACAPAPVVESEEERGRGARTGWLRTPTYGRITSHRFNEIGRGLLQFALDLWRQLELQSGRRSGNVLFSPYVLASTLEALLHAAKGGTGHQIANALKLPGRHVYLHDYFARLHAQCRSCLGVSSLRFKLRNLMHHDRSVRVRREFRRRDGGVHALAHDLSGDAEGSFASIVDQVREAVPRFAAHEILPPESLAHASIVLLSFVVFAGGWRVRFSRARTTDAVFHLGPGRTKKVQDGGLPKPMLRLCRGIGLKSAAVI